MSQIGAQIIHQLANMGKGRTQHNNQNNRVSLEKGLEPAPSILGPAVLTGARVHAGNLVQAVDRNDHKAADHKRKIESVHQI